MEDLEKALNEYAELVTQSHKLEDEIIALPRSAAQKIGVSISLLTAVDSRDGLFVASLFQKLRELKEVEAKRDEARRKFVQILRR